MPYLAAATDRRAISVILSDADLDRAARQVEEIDALYGDVDLLPLDTLVALTERRRAA